MIQINVNNILEVITENLEEIVCVFVRPFDYKVSIFTMFFFTSVAIYPNDSNEISYSTFQSFPNSTKEWRRGGGGKSEIFLTGFFLLGDGNLMKSDFDHSNFFLTAFFKY